MATLSAPLALLTGSPLAVAAPVPSGRPDGDGHVAGYVTSQGRRFALPGGVWTFITGQGPESGEPFRVMLARAQDQRLTGTLELEDFGVTPSWPGPIGSALVCTLPGSLGVAAHPPLKVVDGDHDGVRLDVNTGAGVEASRDPLAEAAGSLPDHLDRRAG